jgi:hypothetical protein
VDRRRERLAQALDETGLWRSAEPAERKAQLDAIRLGEYPLDQAVFRDVCFMADGSRLAEGNVSDLLGRMSPALAEYGLRLRIRETPTPHTVEINGMVCVVGRTPTAEHAATIRPLALVNVLLERADAPVRVFTLYAGDAEGLAYLLSPRVPRLLTSSGLYDRHELPVLAAP